MYLTYAKSKAGELVHIDQDRSTPLFCPYCNGAVVAKRGPVVGHHYAHRQDSCRPEGYAPLPSEPGYFYWSLSGPQFNALEKVGKVWRWFEAGKIHAQTRRVLVAGNFIETWQQPAPANTKRDILGGCLAPRGLARLRLLSLPAWASFVAGELNRLAKGAEKPPYLSAEGQRLAESSLYFLEIEGSPLPVYKIGVTSRPVVERIAEIRRALDGDPAIEVLRLIPGAGAVEPYFKWLFIDKVVLGTEYFTGLDVAKVLDELDQVAEVKLPEQPRLLYERREFTGIFSHASNERNEYTDRYDPYVHLVNIKDWATGERVLDHHMWKIGKNWAIFERAPLPGQFLKFTATLEGNRLLRPAKVEKIW